MVTPYNLESPEERLSLKHSRVKDSGVSMGARDGGSFSV